MKKQIYMGHVITYIYIYIACGAPFLLPPTRRKVAQARAGSGSLHPKPGRQQRWKGYTAEAFPHVTAAVPTTPDDPKGWCWRLRWPRPGGDSPSAAKRASGPVAAKRQTSNAWHISHAHMRKKDTQTAHARRSTPYSTRRATDAMNSARLADTKTRTLGRGSG